MNKNWPLIHKYVLAYEGGYVNHPKDPGGATNKGVTQRVYDGFRDGIGEPQRSVRLITDNEVDTIYRQQYWSEVKGDLLPSGLDLTVYDFAVNSGPSRSIKFLQRELGVKADGRIGNVTLGAIEALDREGVKQVIKNVNDARWAWLKRLKHWGTFGKGWTRRVMGDAVGVQNGDYGVVDRSIALAARSPLPPPTAAAVATAPLGVAARTDAEKEDRNVTSLVKDVVTDGRAITTAVSMGGYTTIQNVAETDGPLAWAISIALVIAVAGGVVLLVKELRRD